MSGDKSIGFSALDPASKAKEAPTGDAWTFQLGSFSRNLGNEVARSMKFYFYDNGVRNAAMDDIRPLDSRMDQGALWESFIVAERRKRRNWHGRFHSGYFRRLSSGPEIDYVEEGGGELHAGEIG